MNTASYTAAMLAATTLLGACGAQPTATVPAANRAARAEAAPPAVEHWTARGAGYELTFYPGFVSRAVVQGAGAGPVELYRQAGSFPLPPGVSRPSGEHRVVLRGGPRGRDVALGVLDRANSIARITLALRAPGGGEDSVETVTLLDNAQTCPPVCGSGGGGVILSVSYPELEGGSTTLAAADAGSAPWTGRALGFEVTADPSFARRATIHAAGGLTATLDGGARPAGRAAPAEHRVRIAGGPLGRDVTLRVRDPRGVIVRMEVEFHGGATMAAGGEEVVLIGG